MTINQQDNGDSARTWMGRTITPMLDRIQREIAHDDIPQPMDGKVIARLKRHMKTITPTMDEISWLNEHMNDIINTTGGDGYNTTDTFWSYIAGAIQRHRAKPDDPIINNNHLMHITAWCHGDIMVGGEDTDILEAKNALMHACLDAPRPDIIPCPREWLPVGRQYQMNRTKLTTPDRRKLIITLNALAHGLTHPDHTIITARDVSATTGIMQGWKAPSRNMLNWYEHTPMDAIDPTGTSLIITIAEARHMIDGEIHPYLFNGRGEYRKDDDTMNVFIALIATYIRQGSDEQFIRQAIHLMLPEPRHHMDE